MNSTTVNYLPHIMVLSLHPWLDRLRPVSKHTARVNQSLLINVVNHALMYNNDDTLAYMKGINIDVMRGVVAEVLSYLTTRLQHHVDLRTERRRIVLHDSTETPVGFALVYDIKNDEASTTIFKLQF